MTNLGKYSHDPADFILLVKLGSGMIQTSEIIYTSGPSANKAVAQVLIFLTVWYYPLSK